MDDYFLAHPMRLLLMVLAAIVAAIILMIVTITHFDAKVQKRYCHRYANVTHRETQFRRFSYWQFDCFVRTNDGKWVRLEQFRGVS